MRRRKVDAGDFRQSPGSSNSDSPREARIAMCCRGDVFRILTTLDRQRAPVDVWLHRNRRHLAAMIKRHPMTRRVLFSPVRDARFASDVHSRLPVYGAYDKVIDT